MTKHTVEPEHLTSTTQPMKRGENDEPVTAGPTRNANGKEPSSNKLVGVAQLHDLPSGVPLGVNVAGMELVAVNHQGQVNLFEGQCLHQGTLLAEGTVENGALVCRAHGWRYDCASGAKLDNSQICLKKFTTILKDGQVLVDSDEVRTWKERGVSPETAAIMTPGLRSVQDLPGPKGLPLLGNLMQLDVKRLHLILEQWGHQFGSIYTFKLGQKPVVVIADSALNSQILRERPETYRRMGAIESVFKEMGINGVFSAEGEDWRRQRRLAMEALSNKHLRHFFPSLTRVIQRLQKRWEKAAHAHTAVDVQKDLMRFTVDVTTNLAFGYDMNTLEAEGDVIQRHLEKIFPMIARRINAPWPYWRYFNLPIDRDLDKALAEIRQIINSFIAHTRSRLAQNPDLAQQPTNFLEAMLAWHDEDEAQFTDDEIFGNVFTMLLAGEDTTANTMTWMMHYMAMHPDVQRQMQAEADAILGDADLLEDIKVAEKLPYIEAVAQETMRLKPVAPLYFLETNKDVIVADVQISKGTAVTLLARPGVMDQSNFEHAHEFRPERWLSGCPFHGAHNRAAHVPFGSGPRLCPGRSLALLEIKTAMAMICRHFDVTQVSDPQQVRERFAFAMMPTGLSIQFNPRRRDIAD